METHHEGIDVQSLKINDTEVLDAISGLHAVKKVVKVALAAAAGAGGVLAWANPEGASIIVTRLVLDITTQATGVATADAGVAANGTTSSDTLLDAVDIGSAPIVADNIENQGTNGGSVRKMTSTQYITVSASADPAGLVGYAYIEYFKA